jgi:phosphopantothenoylcysteine decarboxylase/phosphopantothenate--cysteine ligase
MPFPFDASTTITLAVGGGIAAYKACDFIREAQRHGVGAVHPILTPDAQQFITPLTLASLAMQPAVSDAFALDDRGVPLHIALAQKTDALVILPTTANLLAKLANGFGDNIVTATALTFTNKPIILVPAMNTRMWENPLVQANLQTLTAQPNITCVMPKAGLLACGETGQGHLAPYPLVLEALYKATHPAANRFTGLNVLVTAGGTVEPLDVARVLTNNSTGKMGLAFADELHAMGATVTLVTAQQELPVRAYTVIQAKTVATMQAVVLSHAPQQDWIVKAAAVSDFRLLEANPVQKLKKDVDQSTYSLTFGLNPDILALLGHQKTPQQVLVGFAAETQTCDTKPLLDKLHRKGASVLLVNNVATPGLGFGGDKNQFKLVYPDGVVVETPVLSKPLLARHTLLALAERFLS